MTEPSHSWNRQT